MALAGSIRRDLGLLFAGCLVLGIYACPERFAVAVAATLGDVDAKISDESVVKPDHLSPEDDAEALGGNNRDQEVLSLESLHSEFLSLREENKRLLAENMATHEKFISEFSQHAGTVGYYSQSIFTNVIVALSIFVAGLSIIGSIVGYKLIDDQVAKAAKAEGEKVKQELLPSLKGNMLRQSKMNSLMVFHSLSFVTVDKYEKKFLAAYGARKPDRMFAYDDSNAEEREAVENEISAGLIYMRAALKVLEDYRIGTDKDMDLRYIKIKNHNLYHLVFSKKVSEKGANSGISRDEILRKADDLLISAKNYFSGARESEVIHPHLETVAFCYVMLGEKDPFRFSEGQRLLKRLINCSGTDEDIWYAPSYEWRHKTWEKYQKLKILGLDLHEPQAQEAEEVDIENSDEGGLKRFFDSIWKRLGRQKNKRSSE